MKPILLSEDHTCDKGGFDGTVASIVSSFPVSFLQVNLVVICGVKCMRRNCVFTDMGLSSSNIVDVVSGTHASGNLLAYLAFNKCVLDTLLYCEMYRISGERMYLSCMTLTNWLEKGSYHQGAHQGVESVVYRKFRYNVYMYFDDKLVDMEHFCCWTQLFAYRHDGSYSIDNSIAERFIRPFAGECKNFLFFGSDKMARFSAVYHTIISTCKMQGTLC